MIVFTFIGVNAQNVTTASGGEATGSGGASSYTVGQIAYTTDSASDGSIAQGVQQPLEIYTTAGVEETEINLELTAYPNPTTDLLTLRIGNYDYSELTYQLTDLHGKLLETKPLVSMRTNIKMENHPKSIYFLQVSNGQAISKTFKIIKN